MTHRLHFIAWGLLLPLLATQFGNGCVSDDAGGTTTPPPDRYDDRPVSGNASGGTSSSAGGGTTAAPVRPGTPRRLPRDVDLVREGREKVRWTADLDGTVYVYDVDADHIAWTGDVRRGQGVLVDPKRDSVMVGDKVVYHDNLGRDALHRIYFATDRSRDRDDRDEDRDNSRPMTERERAAADGVPVAAEGLASGRGELQIKKVPADGTVYVYDTESRRIMMKRDVRRGDSFQIVPQDDYIRENGKRTGALKLDADHKHVLYFKARSN